MTPFPPEAALSSFISIVPASIEEPAVQQFGELAGELGLIVATVIAAFVYGLILVVLDRLVAHRLAKSLKPFETLLVMALVPWLLFGLVLFPLTGVSVFGIGSGFASSSSSLAFPLGSLLSQGVFALVLSPRYRPRADISSLHARTEVQGRYGSRREFIEKSTIGVLALVAGAVGLLSLGSLFSSQIKSTGGSPPIDLAAAPAIFRDPRLATLVESEVTPNDRFYRVAIDIIDPAVNAADWSLSLDGLVASPKRYSLAEVQALPPTTQYTTFECVSNKINGDLVGNAKWTGVRLSDLFHDAGGVRAGAKYVVFYSVDGYSVGIPIEKALMVDSMVAYTMNDETLPTRHGYPLRAVIPGLYGMMSAKWIKQISLLDLPQPYLGYWQNRGWTNDARINTVAFVTQPGSGDEVSLLKDGGSVLLAGYAFAGDRGVSKVEVSFDEGDSWQEAQLKNPISGITWVLWAYDWHPSKTGAQFIYVRATDGNGEVQVKTPTDTFPNGATGYAYVVPKVVN